MIDATTLIDYNNSNRSTTKILTSDTTITRSGRKISSKKKNDKTTTFILLLSIAMIVLTAEMGMMPMIRALKIPFAKRTTASFTSMATRLSKGTNNPIRYKAKSSLSSRTMSSMTTTLRTHKFSDPEGNHLNNGADSNTKIPDDIVIANSNTSSSTFGRARSYILSQNPEPEDQEPIMKTLDWLERVVIGLNFCPFAAYPLSNAGGNLANLTRSMVDRQKSTTKLNSRRDMNKNDKTIIKPTTPDLSVQVIHGTDQTEIIRQVVAESMIRQSKPGTSLIVCPDLFPTNFRSFLEVYQIIQDGVLPDVELDDDIQIAPFHPLFEFDESESVSTDEGDDYDDMEQEETHESQTDDDDDDPIENYTNRSPYPIFHVLREEEVSRAVKTLDGDASKIWKRNVEVLQTLDDDFSSGRHENPQGGDGATNTTIENNTDGNHSQVMRRYLRQVVLKGSVPTPTLSTESTIRPKSVPLSTQTIGNTTARRNITTMMEPSKVVDTPTKRSFSIYACGEGWTGSLGHDHLRTTVIGHFDEEDEDEYVDDVDNGGQINAQSYASSTSPSPLHLVPIYEGDDVQQVSVGWATTAYLNTQGHVYMVGRPHDVMNLLRMARMPAFIRNYVLRVTENRQDHVEATLVGKWISQLIGWATGTTSTSEDAEVSINGPNDNTWDLAKRYSSLKDWTRLDLRSMMGSSFSSAGLVLKDTRFSSVVCGPGMTALIGKDSGSLYMMGVNNRGQCGVGRISNNVWVPEQVQGLSYGLQTKNQGSASHGSNKMSRSKPQTQDIPVVQVALGFQHCIALTQDGQAFSWGKGNRGQLGRPLKDNDQDAIARPIKIPIQPSSNGRDSTIVQVGAGHHHGALLTDDNRVYLWGKNMSRGTSQGTDSATESEDESLESVSDESSKPTDALIPEQVVGLSSTMSEGDEIEDTRVLQISCGSHHTAILLEDGSIHAVGIASDFPIPILDPVELIPPGVLKMPVRFFEAHFDRTTVIDANGAVYQAHLWNDSSLRAFAYFTPSFINKLVDRGETIESIHRGWKHTCVVTR